MGQRKTGTKSEMGTGYVGIPCRFEIGDEEEVAIQVVSAGIALDPKPTDKVRLDIEELTALLLESQNELDFNSKVTLASILPPGLKRSPRHLSA